MKIKYNSTIRDQLAFAAYHFPRSPMILFISIGFFLFFTFENVIPEMPKDKSPAFQIFFVIFYEVILAFIVAFVWTIIVLAEIVSKKNKTLVAERTVTFGDESFVSESAFARSEYKWPMVQKLARTRGHLFLYFNKNAAMIVPHRAFESKAAWDEFYDYCRNKTQRAT